jgi:hypothetical protein
MIPSIIKLNNKELIHKASRLPSSGTLVKSANNLIYLNINDAYIHHLFPLLKEKQIKKPNYFGKGLAGAHISVIYPEEAVQFDTRDLGKQYQFKINELIIAEMNLKKYYVVLVECPELRQLRNKYGLADQLNFKNYWIDLHITVGVF